MDASVPSPSSQGLTDQVDWVRDLARGLVSDADLADDLAQETLLDALHTDGSSVRSVRGWLSVVMHRRLTDFRRREGRFRERREALARRPITPSTLDLVERASVCAAVVEELDELPDRYRDTLVLRYFEGLTPKEIAARAGVPVSSVKTRLQRGLAQLRERLSERNGGDERSWVASLVALVATEPSRAPAPAVPRLALSVVVTVGAVVLATAVVFTALRANRAPDPDERVASLPAVLGPGERAGNDEPPDLGASSVTRTNLAPRADSDGPATADPTAAVRGRAVLPDGRPAAGVDLRFDELNALDGEATLTTTSAADGTFGFHTTLTGGLVRVMEERFATLRAGRFGNGEGELTVVVSERRRLKGRVLDDLDEPLVHARLEVLPPEVLCGDATSVSMQNFVHTGPAGRFALDEIAAVEGTRLRVTRSGFETLEIALPADDRDDMEIVLAALPEVDQVHGRVLDANGRPVQAARVALVSEEVRSDEQGYFRMGLPEDEPGPWTIRALAAGHQSAEAVGTRNGDEVVWDDLPGEVLLELGPPPLSISGRVVDETGSPLPSLRVWVADPTPFKLPRPTGEGLMLESANGFEIHPDDVSTMVENILAGKQPSGWSPAYTDPDGNFRIDGLGARDYTVGVLQLNTLRWQMIPGVAAGTEGLELWWEPRPAWTMIEGRVVDLHGMPVDGAQLVLILPVQSVRVGSGKSSSSSTIRTAAVTGADGRFTLTNVSREGLGLQVRGPDVFDRGRWLNDAVHGLVESSEGLSGLVLTVARQARFRLVDAEHVDADGLILRDLHGEVVLMHRVEGGRRTLHERALVEGGQSRAFEASQEAVELVLLKGDVEVEKLPLMLRAGEQNLVRP